MVYINIKDGSEIETLDQFETYSEAHKMLKEYRVASPYYADAYLSQLCTKTWRTR